LKRKYITVRVVPEVGIQLKNAATRAGKSVSEMAGDLIKLGLENPIPTPSGVAVFDQDLIKNSVENAIKTALKNVATGSNSLSIFSPEVVHFLLETLTKTQVMTSVFFKKGMTIQESVSADLKIDAAVKAEFEKLFR